MMRNRAGVLNPMAFMFLAVMLFAVGSPLQDESRAQYGGAVLWLIVLLTNMLSLDALFRRDYDNGVLEQMICSAQAPFLVVLMRVFVQWLGSGLLITLLAPLLCLFFGVTQQCNPDNDAGAIMWYTSAEPAGCSGLPQLPLGFRGVAYCLACWCCFVFAGTGFWRQRD